MAKTSSLSSPRIRFNWGFHDGVHAHQTKAKNYGFIAVKFSSVYEVEEKHFDKIYAKGWLYGWQASTNGWNVGTSEESWRDYKATKAKA